MKKKVYIENLGCPKNLVDSERLLGAFIRNGFTYTNNPQDAEIIIVNTCSFLKDSRKEAIEIIFDFVELKKQKLEKLIVTGCLVETNEKELKEEFKEIDYVINNRKLDEMFSILSFKKESEEFYCCNRNLINNTGFAYLKVSEGCNRRCSFCNIPLFKGNLVSRSISSLIEETKTIVDTGVKELILVAQDLTDYGKDIGVDLVKLLNELARINDLKWIRLLYTYPTSITDDLINTIANNDKICSYIDIPLQHIDDEILKLMNRQGNKKIYYELIEKLRKKIPNIAIRSTFIVGFPSETDKQFKNLFNSIKELELDRVGVFSYSKEDDTPSSQLENQVHKKVKEERRRIIMELQESISERKLQNRVGKEYEVIIDEEVVSKKNEIPYFLSRSEFEAPEVDGNIVIRNKNLKIGNWYKVKIIESYEHDMLGEIV